MSDSRSMSICILEGFRASGWKFFGNNLFSSLDTSESDSRPTDHSFKSCRSWPQIPSSLAHLCWKVIQPHGTMLNKPSSHLQRRKYSCTQRRRVQLNAPRQLSATQGSPHKIYKMSSAIPKAFQVSFIATLLQFGEGGVLFLCSSETEAKMVEKGLSKQRDKWFLWIDGIRLWLLSIQKCPTS